MKLLKKITRTLFYTVLFLFITANLFIILSGRFYLYKGISNTYLQGRSGPGIYDLNVFAYETLHHAQNPFVWKTDFSQAQLETSELAMMEKLRTTSFLVFKGDQLIFEKYWGDHNVNTVSNSFSATKTFVALLIGAAIQDGYIHSLDDRVGQYLSDWNDGAKKQLTIRHLLMMSSGLDWQESGKNPLSENAESYYGTDLWGLINRQKIIEKPGKRFNYQSGNSQLLGFIIEKASGKGLSQYAEEKIWSKIGTEGNSYWSLDKEKGDEKAFCCLYGTSRDFGRLGRLIKHQGVWNGDTLIQPAYLREMCSNPVMTTDEGVENLRYGLHIWTYSDPLHPIYYCRGILGQYIITIPDEDLIIVRTGFERLPNIEKHKEIARIGHPADLFEYLSTARRLVSTLKHEHARRIKRP